MRLLGLWCTVLSVAFVWPQVARVSASAPSTGSPPSGTLHVAVAASLWMIYGIARATSRSAPPTPPSCSRWSLIAAQQIRYGTLQHAPRC